MAKRNSSGPGRAGNVRKGRVWWPPGTPGRAARPLPVGRARGPGTRARPGRRRCGARRCRRRPRPRSARAELPQAICTVAPSTAKTPSRTARGRWPTSAAEVLGPGERTAAAERDVHLEALQVLGDGLAPCGTGCASRKAVTGGELGSFSQRTPSSSREMLLEGRRPPMSSQWSSTKAHAAGASAVDQALAQDERRPGCGPGR